MKTLTVRLPALLVEEIEAESRARHRSKSDIVRERPRLVTGRHDRTRAADAIADLVGAVRGLPRDLSARRRAYLKATGYGRKRTGSRRLPDRPSGSP